MVKGGGGREMRGMREERIEGRGEKVGGRGRKGREERDHRICFIYSPSPLPQQT